MEIEQKIHTLTIQTNRKRNSLAAILNRDEGGDALQTLDNVDDLEQSSENQRAKSQTRNLKTATLKSCQQVRRF